MSEIIITVIHPGLHEKTKLTAYSKQHVKRIIKSVIEGDNRRIRMDSQIIEEILNELTIEKKKNSYFERIKKQ